jgi:hypothetical protein
MHYLLYTCANKKVLKGINILISNFPSARVQRRKLPCNLSRAAVKPFLCSFIAPRAHFFREEIFGNPREMNKFKTGRANRTRINLQSGCI